MSPHLCTVHSVQRSGKSKVSCTTSPSLEASLGVSGPLNMRLGCFRVEFLLLLARTHARERSGEARIERFRLPQSLGNQRHDDAALFGKVRTAFVLILIREHP